MYGHRELKKTHRVYPDRPAGCNGIDIIICGRDTNEGRTQKRLCAYEWIEFSVQEYNDYMHTVKAC